MNMKQLEIDLGRRLEESVYLSSARTPMAEQLLDFDDRQRLQSFTSTDRKNQWLRGRSALSAIASRLNIETRLSALNPPCKGISLTHNGQISIAAGIPTAQGIGIVFQPWRQIEPGILSCFLTDNEQDQLLVPSNFTRLRLWAVKQALFKASVDNHGSRLTDFEIDAVALITGHARNITRAQSNQRYTSFMLRQGLLSIAIAD